MQKTLFTLFFSMLFLSLSAQYSGPRLFLDVPVIYAVAPDVSNLKNQLGAGTDIAFNVASHWHTVRIGGGSTFTVDPNADDVGESFVPSPFALLEAGVGMYRSNGNKCAKTKSNAFTAMAVVGTRYTFKTEKTKGAEGFDFGVGAEFGYFFIRDIFRNHEVFLRGTYYPESKVTAATFGFKMFLNMRAVGQ
ncbi:MAG: hypothetical protein R2792_15250 [Saprospiraceae bacterium]